MQQILNKFFPKYYTKHVFSKAVKKLHSFLPSVMRSECKYSLLSKKNLKLQLFNLNQKNFPSVIVCELVRQSDWLTLRLVTVIKPFFIAQSTQRILVFTLLSWLSSITKTAAKRHDCTWAASWTLLIPITVHEYSQTYNLNQWVS